MPPSCMLQNQYVSEPAGLFIGADNVEPFSFEFVAFYMQHLHWCTPCAALVVCRNNLPYILARLGQITCYV